MVKKTLAVLFAFTALAALPQLWSQNATPKPAPVPLAFTERNVPMQTRDGVTLRADVYTPSGDGPFPVLLQRTPYNKDNGSDFARRGVARGFMVVLHLGRGFLHLQE